MGDVGAIATLLNTVASWMLNPQGYAAWSRRQELARSKQEVIHALDRHDFDAVEYHLNRMRELASKP